MKRHGHLLPLIADPANLRLAFWKACRGKRGKKEVVCFRECLDENLAALSADLRHETCVIGEYHYFTIQDPKERRICAARFRERVLHHALMNVCEPILEKLAIADSYACRKGKGRLKAIERAQAFGGRHGWFLKMDIRKYFDSIRHETLRGLLARRFKDPGVLRLMDRILASYQTCDGRGLPIGNLTSQHFANFYLAPLDRFVKETLRRRAYVRYMDDFVVWGDSKGELREVRDRVKTYLEQALGLALKPEPHINRVALGMDFLGYRLVGTTLRLNRRSAHRFAVRLRAHEAAFERGELTERDLQCRVTALVAFTLPAQAHGWRRQVIERFGVTAEGLQPRESRGQLEQQRQELPMCEP